MKHLITCGALALLAFAAAPAGAACSLRSLAGSWMFATGVGSQSVSADIGGISALGIFTVDRAGKVAGKFDANLQNGSPMVGVKFDGTLTVNADCTGVLTFSTAQGATRTDSLVIVNAREIAGMSRDPQFAWTYQMRRL